MQCRWDFIISCRSMCLKYIPEDVSNVGIQCMQVVFKTIRRRGMSELPPNKIDILNVDVYSKLPWFVSKFHLKIDLKCTSPTLVVFDTCTI